MKNKTYPKEYFILTTIILVVLLVFSIFSFINSEIEERERTEFNENLLKILRDYGYYPILYNQTWLEGKDEK